MPMTIKGERLFVPCNKCNFCLQKKRNEWAFRLSYELKRSNSAHFLTLTYDDEHIPLLYVEQYRAEIMVLEKTHLTSFFKLLKQKQKRWLKSKRLKGKPIKYYAVGEYGTKRSRPHYHAIIYNIHPELVRKLQDGELWTNGTLHWGEVNGRTINYTAKYIIDKDLKTFDTDYRPRPFAIMSKGLGDNYIEKRQAWHLDGLKYYLTQYGVKQSLPRYYKDRIFTQEQRQIAGEKAKAEAEEVTEKEIIKLIEQYGDEQTAIEKWQEQLKHKHDLIRIKSKKLNKI